MDFVNPTKYNFFSGKGNYTVIYSVRIDIALSQHNTPAQHSVKIDRSYIFIPSQTLTRVLHLLAHANHCQMVSATLFYSCLCVASPSSTHESTCTCREVLILGEAVHGASTYDAPDPSGMWPMETFITETCDEVVVVYMGA